MLTIFWPFIKSNLIVSFESYVFEGSLFTSQWPDFLAYESHYVVGWWVGVDPAHCNHTFMLDADNSGATKICGTSLPKCIYHGGYSDINRVYN